MYNRDELGEKSKQILAQLNYPIDFSANQQNLIAFIHTEINEPSHADKLISEFNKSQLA